MASPMSYQNSSKYSFRKPSSKYESIRSSKNNLIPIPRNRMVLGAKDEKKSDHSLCNPPHSKELCDKKICEDTQRRQSCYPEPKKTPLMPCPKKYEWQHGTYIKDECGSGIVPNRMNFRRNQKRWCKTPLSMYQSTIGELGRQLLCGETRVSKEIKDAPPCNVCEYVLPLCREYYRKYDCIKKCETDLAQIVNGKKVYRDPVERYWFPCMTLEERNKNDIRSYAPHNKYLGEKLRRAFHDESSPCW